MIAPDDEETAMVHPGCITGLVTLSESGDPGPMGLGTQISPGPATHRAVNKQLAVTMSPDCHKQTIKHDQTIRSADQPASGGSVRVSNLFVTQRSFYFGLLSLSLSQYSVLVIN